MHIKPPKTAGFTLIELSIVLVIIGLIVGGVLVGQDLIRSAEIRATVSQIEKYNTAVNTFYGKYGYLPGDINATAAAQFGFTARGPYPGQGDGNGIIEGVQANAPQNNNGIAIFSGEAQMFWVDLSKLGLIDGGFTINNILQPTASNITSTQVAKYLPEAKLGRGNYVYVWSGGWQAAANMGNQYNNPTFPPNGVNYFGISAIFGGSSGLQGIPFSNVSMTVAQAYNIDKKMDDGMPQSGRVMAMYIGYGVINNESSNWAAGGSSDPSTGQQSTGDYNASSIGPAVQASDIGDGMAAGAYSCYDGSQGIPEHYSIQVNGGSNANCALSFQFQ